MRLPEGAAAAARTDPGIAGLLDAEQRLFAARLAAFEGAVGLQRTRIAQLQEQVAATVSQQSPSCASSTGLFPH